MEHPFASFRHAGAPVSMSLGQFAQALADSHLCGCRDCLCCRTREYWQDAAAEMARTEPARLERLRTAIRRAHSRARG